MESEVVGGGYDVQKPLQQTKIDTNLRFTTSVHLLNMGHTAIIGLVIIHFAMRLHYSWYGGLTFTNTGGKLDRQVNFELAELLGSSPSYNNIASSPGKFFASS